MKKIFKLSGGEFLDVPLDQEQKFKELSKKFNCNFSKMNNSKFDKICHKYEIILIRFIII